jgi:hypothetical protein
LTPSIAVVAEEDEPVDRGAESLPVTGAETVR